MPGGTIHTPCDHYCIDEHGLTNSIGYCAQIPCTCFCYDRRRQLPNRIPVGLDHSSIRDNILFSSPLDESRYTEVIRCCGLSEVLTLLKDGDQTDTWARDSNIDASVKAR